MAVPGFSSLSLGEDDSVHKSGTNEQTAKDEGFV